MFPNFRFPFNTKNPFGFFVATILQYFIAKYFLSCVAILVAIAINSYFIVVAVAQNLRDDLESIGENAKNISDRTKMIKHISNFTRFHSYSKQLSDFCVYSLHIETNPKIFFMYFRLIDDFVGIFQPVFMVEFTWCLATISGTMLMFQVEIV